MLSRIKNFRNPYFRNEWIDHDSLKYTSPACNPSMKIMSSKTNIAIQDRVYRFGKYTSMHVYAQVELVNGHCSF
jgi:hypothetical protein